MTLSWCAKTAAKGDKTLIVELHCDGDGCRDHTYAESDQYAVIERQVKEAGWLLVGNACYCPKCRGNA